MTERQRANRALHPRVAVNAMCSARWTLAEDLAFWGQSGITRVSIALPKVEAAGWDEGVAAVSAAPVDVVTVLASTGLHLDQPEVWPAEQAALRRAVDGSAAMGARSMYFSSGPPGRLDADEAASVFADAVAPVRAYADTLGMPIAIEHNHALRRDLGFIHTLADMVDLVAQPDVDLGIVVEFNNCWIERHLAETFRRGAHRFTVVQISDFAIGTHDTPNRLVPGDGDIPIEKLVRMLLDAGYTGPFDLEYLGPRIEAEGYASAITRGAAWMSDLLDRLGA